MNHEEKRTESITIRGVGADVDKATAREAIGALWGRAAQSGAIDASAPTYGVYTDYADRLANRYRVVVGQEASAGEASVTLPAGDYVVFEGRGPAAEVAQRLWRHVWTEWEERDRRTFDVDFERYEGSPDDAKVSLFIQVTPAK